jgi:hypothetical protein
VLFSEERAHADRRERNADRLFSRRGKDFRGRGDEEAVASGGPREIPRDDHGLQRLPYAVENGPEGPRAGHDADALRPPAGDEAAASARARRTLDLERHGTLTAFAGPWGISYAINLTPDQNTGIGIWTEELFIKALRTGKHFGTSRDIQPPMPWPWYGKASEADPKAIYAYLRSIPPIKNLVPDYEPPKAATP